MSSLGNVAGAYPATPARTSLPFLEEALDAAADHVFVLEDAVLAGARDDPVDRVPHQRHVVLHNASEFFFRALRLRWLVFFTSQFSRLLLLLSLCNADRGQLCL